VDNSVRTRVIVALGAALLAPLGASVLVAPPAMAATDGSNVVISEAYLSGGSAGAAYANKYVELFNPTASAVSLAGWSLQYRPATSIGAATSVVPLSGSVAAGAHYLIAGGSNGTAGAALPTPDITSTFNPSGAGGTIILSDNTVALALTPGSIAGVPDVIDLLGYGTSNTFEGVPATAPTSNTDVRSLNRTAGGADSDNNGVDFALSATLTPTGSGGITAVTDLTIEQLQGTGASTAYAGQPVVTRGVVTAAYPTGGFDGYYIQTPGTGGVLDPATHTASDAVFVHSPATLASVSIGEYVQVTGTATEYSGLTEVLVDAGGVMPLTLGALKPPTAATVAYPADDAGRERLEGMLLAPQGPFTVTDNHNANQYGELGLAAGTAPLLAPTSVGAVGSADYFATIAHNNAAAVTLDDGSSLNYLSAANQATPLPYLSLTDPVRVGSAVTFTRPVVLDFRNNVWAFQPTSQLTPADAGSVQPATFSNTRGGPADVGGDLRIGTFNVLNYFPHPGTDRVGCTFYNDRAGNPITVNNSDAPGCGVRGAARAEDFARQQAKIVAAINALGADVVSLEEIENSAKLGLNRDTAVITLVTALNAALGHDEWAYVPSPSHLPAIADEDVIRTAFIYKKATVEPVGESAILIGSAAFADAREPDAQKFHALGTAADDDFLVVSNHFKSKSGTGATGDNADAGDGAGAFNGDRTRQAQALVQFAHDQSVLDGTDRVFLVGDFNSYGHEDPVLAIEAAGYTSLDAATGKSSYAFDGTVGSIDHIFASSSAAAVTTGTDVWNVNSVESVAFEYSRFNYNVTSLYDASPYRSSDHDPLLVGVRLSYIGAPPSGSGAGGGDGGGAAAHEAGGILAATGTDGAASAALGASAFALVAAGAALTIRRRRRKAARRA
jgi:predicted extracellular nuclease